MTYDVRHDCRRGSRPGRSCVSFPRRPPLPREQDAQWRYPHTPGTRCGVFKRTIHTRCAPSDGHFELSSQCAVPHTRLVLVPSVNAVSFISPFKPSQRALRAYLAFRWHGRANAVSAAILYAPSSDGLQILIEGLGSRRCHCFLPASSCAHIATRSLAQSLNRKDAPTMP